ncbi:hypothetical protein [Herbidospora mongoliensis]|uniref:hypothetical protein n=1 Tax=Herbidospora mongoliensis TaxID=688067 RepID=UPI0008325841|nr:hypothetical protein [Herbidospora mongoliensis]
MNDFDPRATNYAENSTIGVQAEAVHGDIYHNVYHLPAAPTSQDHFNVGVKYLRGGMPDKAREHIGHAVLHGHISSRSYFYLLLALLSGRTLQQVPKSEFNLLRSAQRRLDDQANDSWSRGIRTINDLLAALAKEDLDSQAVDEHLKKIDPQQRDEILRHLDMFLNGPILDGLWARAFDSAHAKRYENGRLDRAWKFFHPEPAGPRARLPTPARVTFGDQARAWASTAVGAWSLFWLTVASWQSSWSATVTGLLFLAAGAHLCVRNGLEWRHLEARRKARYSERHTSAHRPAAPARGFANNVDRKFDQYFARYLPENADRDIWLSETEGERRILRDEVVELYREDRTNADDVAWLIRHMVTHVRRRWQKGTLWESREPLTVPFATRAQFAGGAVALLTGTVIMTWSAVHLRPVTGALAAMVILVCAWTAAERWSYIRAERRRFAAEEQGHAGVLADRLVAYEKWKHRLSDRPQDTEMADWLDHDRKALMAEAMTRYKLAARDIVAHAFIEGPAKSYRRARVNDGPWRYSRYRIQVLLLTCEGVRQMAMNLDFLTTEIRPGTRLSYQYDKVVAARVEPVFGRKTFELTLVNGDPIKLTVSGEEDDLPEVSELTLDSAGLGNTLHLLEGIAAEGKKWIDNERVREKEIVAELAQASGTVFDRPPVRENPQAARPAT